MATFDTEMRNSVIVVANDDSRRSSQSEPISAPAECAAEWHTQSTGPDWLAHVR